MDVIVEVMNSGEGAIDVSDNYEFTRVVDGPRGVADRTASRPSARLRVVIECHVPEGSKQRFLRPRRRGPVSHRTLSVASGESVLLKVELPTDAFEQGECALVAVLKDGPNEIARSRPIPIQCLVGQAKGPAK